MFAFPWQLCTVTTPSSRPGFPKLMALNDILQLMRCQSLFRFLHGFCPSAGFLLPRPRPHRQMLVASCKRCQKEGHLACKQPLNKQDGMSTRPAEDHREVFDLLPMLLLTLQAPAAWKCQRDQSRIGTDGRFTKVGHVMADGLACTVARAFMQAEAPSSETTTLREICLLLILELTQA